MKAFIKKRIPELIIAFGFIVDLQVALSILSQLCDCEAADPWDLVPSLAGLALILIGTFGVEIRDKQKNKTKGATHERV